MHSRWSAQEWPGASIVGQTHTEDRKSRVFQGQALRFVVRTCFIREEELVNRHSSPESTVHQQKKTHKHDSERPETMPAPSFPTT